MNIIIVGSCYVGKSIGSCINKLGHIAYFYNISKKLDELKNKGNLIIYDYTEIPKLDIDVYFITVSIPTDNKECQDISVIINVIKVISYSIRKASPKQPFVVVKSSILPLITENAVIPHLASLTGFKPNVDFGVIYSPEFIFEIHYTWTNDLVFNIDTGDWGIGEQEAGNIVICELYRGFKEVFRINYRAAEMIKYEINTALAIRFSFWNEIKTSFNNMTGEIKLSDALNSATEDSPIEGLELSREAIRFGCDTLEVTLGGLRKYE